MTIHTTSKGLFLNILLHIYFEQVPDMVAALLSITLQSMHIALLSQYRPLQGDDISSLLIGQVECPLCIKMLYAVILVVSPQLVSHCPSSYSLSFQEQMHMNASVYKVCV